MDKQLIKGRKMKIKKILMTSTILLSLSLNASDSNNTKEDLSLVNKVTQESKTLIKNAKEKIKSVSIEDIKKGATSTWEKTKKVSSSTWEKTKTTANELSENNTSKSLINASGEYLNKFKQYIKSDTNTSTLTKVKEIGKDIKTYGEEKYKELTK